MSYIAITNSGYLTQSVKNRPIIGWHSNINSSGFSSSDTGTGSSADNLWAPDTYTFWESDPLSAGTPKEIVMDLGSAQATNYIFLSNLIFPDGVATYSVKFDVSPDGSAWTNIVDFSSFLEGKVDLIFYFDDEDERFLRLRVEPLSGTHSTDDTIKIAHIRAGEALVLERPTFVGNSPFNRQVEKLTNRSDSGRYLGSTLVSEVRRYNIEQQHNSDTFTRDYVVPFLKHCELIGNDSVGPKGSFCYAWRPEEFPDDVYYCHDPDSVTWPSYSRPNKAIGLDWSISGAAEG